MAVRALRGAITVDADDPTEIRQRTIDMLQALFDRNRLEIDDVISILFTTTTDLRSLPPAAAARAFGLIDVPLLCAQEMETDGSLKHCIRLMLHVETDQGRDELRHVFLRGATTLRPELAEPGDEDW
ncbi:MAG: chorismate mutase [Acidimicrobiia bacterium]|nr:chorismate mutase [Acidimicrobiia bacterium]